MRRLTSLAGAAVIAALAIFAVTNRGPVAVDLWPLPILIEAPAFVLVLGALALGTLLGACMAWTQGGATRRLSRARGREVAALESEVAALRKQVAAATPAAAATGTAVAVSGRSPSPALQALIVDVSRASMPDGLGPQGLPRERAGAAAPAQRT
ncbi:MAG: DUF1049 domain-containing protein [Alphaproteobacteria bacterium]|nr:DUF1049 domain-containing protein [Alphaproteobacteria bacterium]